jgi:hypothetical protein
MTTSSPPPAKRQRGAPPGNQNARKHGLTPRQKNPLYISDRSATIDLLPEIDIMRLHIADLSDAALNQATLPEKFETLRLLTIAVTALTRLVRAQSLVFTTDATRGSSIMDEWEAELERALADANRELCKPDPPETTHPDPATTPSNDPGVRLLQLYANYPGDPHDRKKRR